MKRNDLDDIEIIKPARGKDWNESLVLYKRFDMNLSPTEKITQAVEDIISRLDLRGYHGLSEQIQTKRNEIIKSLYQRLPIHLMESLRKVICMRCPESES